MSIYTKNGDNGLTNLIDTKNISKSDNRIELIGTLEELISNIGLMKAEEIDFEISNTLEEMQKDLLLIKRWVAKPFDKENKLLPESVQRIETEITKFEERYSISKSDIIPGMNKQSAQADVTRTIARRAERRLVENDKKYGGDKNIKCYLNRLSDYLYALARIYENEKEKKVEIKQVEQRQADAKKENVTNEAVVQAVLAQMGQMDQINLETAKKLIEQVEAYSRQKGVYAVIAVCGADGNMIAVHKMDQALLASFDIAMKKAYTSVALKMTTMELGKLAAPGGALYGIDGADNGKLIIFGGGAPLIYQNKIIGGIGVSGGTAKQDHEISLYGQKKIQDIV